MDDLENAIGLNDKAEQGKVKKFHLIIRKTGLSIAYGVTFVVTAGLFPGVSYKEYVA